MDWCSRFESPPRDPPERRRPQILQIMEGLAPPDELGLVRAVGGFGHGVVEESPTVPVDGGMPYSITLVAYTVPVYCTP